MTLAIGVVTASVFFALAILHLVFAMTDRARWLTAAVPHVGGRPAFVPSKIGTLAVALVLGGCAVLVLWRIGLLDAIAPGPLSRAGTGILAVLLVLRAIGEFRLVGFFKRTRDSTFARLDTWLYSPLCAALGAACALIAFAPAAS
jgi:uncharacterized protein DUF3995